MVTEYLNTTENSPITKVEIGGHKGISIDGTPNNEYTPSIFTKDHTEIYYIFDFIAKKVNSPAVTPEIDNAIQNFSAQYIQKLEKKAGKRYDEMAQVITQKSKEAQQEQKKLLVLLGERHYQTDPQCGQLLALDICQKFGITNLLIERPSIDRLIKPSLEHRADITADFLLNIISSSELQQYISLHAIDPLRDDLLYRKVSGLTRNKAINETIVGIGTDAMCIVGVNHIPHIIADPELSKIYNFAIFYNAQSTRYPEYDQKSSEQLDNLLKEQELLALESDKKSQECIEQVQQLERDYWRKYGAL